VHHASPGELSWDLVIVHTVHPDQQHEWLSQQPGVLDTTYRMSHIPQRHVL
jgi:UDP-N-acetyl-D-glucosamine dehydrogenase